MDGKRKFRIPALVAIFVLVVPLLAVAAPPWSKLMGTTTVQADPAKPYRLSDEHGPWVITACSFSGEGAEKQAHDLVIELRKRYKLEAYAYEVRFKLDDPNDTNKAVGAPARWQYKRFKDRPDLYKDGAIKEVAVLIGNFSDVKDPEAERTLHKIKSIEPDCLNVEKAKSTSQTLAALRAIQRDIQQSLSSNRTEKKGPMAHAFITTNPLLPSDYFAPKGGVDELVLRMNKGVTHSLLDCPGKYTVQVAHFTGTVILDQREIQDVQNGKQVESKLTKAAAQAHELTEALRMKGYEAYEFHDRYASLVTVGSFDSVGTPRADGKIEINPRIHAIMKTFGGEPVSGAQGGGMGMKSLAGIPFDIQPIPVEVPKRSISRELARRLDSEQ